jgi:hypothetical protein
MKSRKMRWEGHVGRMVRKNKNRISIRKLVRKRLLRPINMLEDNIKTDIRDMCCCFNDNMNIQPGPVQ